jgi:hypothetical protein
MDSLGLHLDSSASTLSSSVHNNDDKLETNIGNVEDNILGFNIPDADTLRTQQGMYLISIDYFYHYIDNK